MKFHSANKQSEEKIFSKSEVDSIVSRTISSALGALIEYIREDISIVNMNTKKPIKNASLEEKVGTDGLAKRLGKHLKQNNIHMEVNGNTKSVKYKY